MAISSSIGSNVFDILVGLPVPWMLKTIMVDYIPIKSPFVVTHVFLLLMMVGFVIVSIAKLGWKLDMRLGKIMFGLYCVFLICALALEYGFADWAATYTPPKPKCVMHE